MTPAFERHDDAIRMRLREEELDLLRRLRDELDGLLRSGGMPDDAVRRRLFPPAVSGDEDADHELRELIHDDLLEGRLAALEELLALLERAEFVDEHHVVDLVEEEPPLVLGVLNDIRLALGSRIGFDVIERRHEVQDPALQGSMAVMDWFAMWQEQLLQALDPASARHYDVGHDPDQ